MAARQQQPAGAPEVSRLPLMGAYSNRGYAPNKDQRFLNIFPETRKVDQLENTKIFLNKRPGLTLHKEFASGEGRGCIYFNNSFYVVIGNTLYKDGASPTSICTLTNSTGPVGLLVANSSVIGDYLFVCDGVEAWFIDTSDVAIQINDTSLHSVAINNIGAGYGTTPSISFTGGGGSGAAATAVVSNGTLSSITLTNYGTGYSIPPSVVIDSPVVTFNPATAVNLTDNTITVTNHTYGTGNPITYAHGGGSAMGGLTTATVYYTIYVDTNKIKLATTSANATSGTSIDITSVGTGTAHTLTGSAGSATALLNSFPSPHIPTPVFIDGFIMLAKGSDVYNCDLDQPGRWSSEQFLSAEMFPDPVKALSRQNNQICVLGSSSVEFFYNAANASGSPLSRNDSTTLQMGVAAPYSVIGNEKFIFFISQSDSGGRAAWIVEGFQPKKISDEYIERILDAEVDMTDVKGFMIRTKGHVFYVINLPTLGRSLIYDPDEKLWHEWSSNNSGNHAVFAYNFATDNSTGASYLLHSTNGKLCKVDVDNTQDESTNILVELVTNKYDMDTYHQKFLHSVKLVGDRYETTNDVLLYWTNDDYQTWSNPKTIGMSDDFPAFHRLGSFRRRAFKLTHATNQPLRLESLECEYTKGDT